MSDRVRIGLIGTGGIMGGHIRRILANPNAEITGLCDIRAEALTGTVERHPALHGVPQYSDYKELIDQLALKRPVLVGWSMACGELAKYAEQFGSDNVAGFVLVDGFLSEKASPEMVAGISGWMNQLQQDRQKQADGFIRSMFKKPQPEDYVKRVIDASVQVPADTAVVLIYNMIGVKDFSIGLARMNRPVLFAYQPESQPSADYLKSKLGDKLRLERFDGDGHALFVDDPEKFNRALEDFLQTLPK